MLTLIPVSKALKTISPDDRKKGEAEFLEIRLLFSSFQAGGL
jgi:hypothetical protein